MSRTITMLGCDGFLLALDHMMRRSGQGAHLSQTVVELDRPPEMDRVREAWRGFVRDHPIVLARQGRSYRNALPVWRLPAPRDEPAAGALPPPAYWHETGPTHGQSAEDSNRAGSIRGPANDAKTFPAGGGQVDSLQALCRDRRGRGQGEKAKSTGPLLQLDVLERADGSAAAIMTWSHLLVDGKGVELIFAELARRCRGDLGQPTPSVPDPRSAAKPAGSTVKAKIQRSRAFADHFADLQKTRFASLGGAKRFGGPISCRVVTLEAHTSEQVNERAQRLTSQLITTPFFLAAAAVAHARVFEHRGQRPGPQIITLPVQIRPKGGAGPLFQNYVSILFFKLDSDQLDSVESATAELRKQFAKMMRNRLDSSFTMMLDLMRWMPPAIYARFLRMQMHGEITSFFSSYTGGFAPPLAGASGSNGSVDSTQAQGLAATDLSDFAGSHVTNAWHIPVISTPPGTGLFMGQYAQRLSISMSWRDGAIDRAEQDLLLQTCLEEMAGGPLQEVDTRLWR